MPMKLIKGKCDFIYGKELLPWQEKIKKGLTQHSSHKSVGSYEYNRDAGF